MSKRITQRNFFKPHGAAALFVMASFSIVRIASAVEFYVSQDGDDGSSGGIKQPFATLSAAKKAVRNVARKNPADDKTVTVYLRGGTYVVSETLVFGLQDSAPDGTVIRYLAYEDEVPVLTSLKPVNGWKRANSLATGLPEASKGKVWVADIDVNRKFKTLYGNGTMLPRARSTGFNPIRSAEGQGHLKRLTIPKDLDLRQWANVSDIEVMIRPTYPWAMNILPVADMDADARTITTTVGGTYPLEPHPQPFIDAHGISNTCWLENAIDYLDSPGEWVLDSTKGKLYLWPVDGLSPVNIAAPQCVELIRVEGEMQENRPVDQTVRGLEFKGITFTGNDRYTWKDNEASFQHDWSAVDQPSAMFRLRCATDCAVEGCTFVQGATTGVRLDLQATGNRIEGNRFSELGEHGIALCGYGAGTKDLNKRNQILNNRIDHIGRLYWYGSGIYVAQSGENQIANNLIHNVPFIGITLSGARSFNYQRPALGEGYRSIRWQDFSERNKKMLQDAYAKGEERTDFFLSSLHARDNQIEGNEIFAAVETMGDGNAIYLSGAGTGNRIRRNYIHHILSDGVSTAMRPDDLQEQTTFEQNIIYKCVYGAIEHKHTNNYINNIFACIYPTNPHGRKWAEWAYFIFGRGPNTGSRIQNNVFYAEGGDPRFYYSRWNSPMDDSFVDNNLYWCAENPESAEKQLKALQEKGHDQHGIAANPQFANITNGDFSLAANSPARDIGFEPIDVSSIGLQVPWKERLVGKILLQTLISPPTGYFISGASVSVTLACNRPDAIIRYTIDGTEPTKASPIYETALHFNAPAYVRAKSFSEGAIDLYGAAEFYCPESTTTP